MSKKVLLLFDVDGTLTKSRNNITPEVKSFLEETSKRVDLAVVGGSDFGKILEQLGSDVDKLHSTYRYVFSENGLVGFDGRKALPEESINKALGEERLQEVINFVLHYFSTVKLPLKRGNFVEFRKGMLNVSPIGRSCSQAERDDFVKYDAVEHVRAKFVEALEEKFDDYGLSFSIGGQISVDIFPKGWDKTYCLKYLTPHYDSIYFFGDKTSPGGNDYEIFLDQQVKGNTVTSPEHTRHAISELLKELGY